MDLIEKSFYSIGDVEKTTGVKPYILRYWEQEFRILRPARRTSGQRKYTKNDIQLIFKIKELLYTKGFTIGGAKKYLIEEKRKRKKQSEFSFGRDTESIEILNTVKKELKAITELLK